MRRSVSLRALVAVLVLCPVGSAAQDPSPGDSTLSATAAPVLIPEIHEPIVLDGRLDEAAWKTAARFGATMFRPVVGGQPSERTEFLLMHDAEYIYFACLSYDSDPGRIRALSLERDETGFASDRCALFIDATNDDQTSVAFYTSPAGVRTDYLYSDDGVAIPNHNWNTFWDVAVSSDDRGWYGEFRIPFSSLVFDPVDGRAVMGVEMLRNIARKNEMELFPAASGRFTRGWGKASEMRKIVLEGVHGSNPAYVTPYLLGGGGYAREPNASGIGWKRVSNPLREAGGDVRYSLTSNLTMDLTANTDFAQVEADDQQVNLTRFSLFFPEKRRFFQERSSVFEYPLGGNEKLFHSRRVGLANGVPVRIFGGARIVGRIGDWDVGALDMQTAHSELLPSENLGVFRVRRRVLNPTSFVGGILTSRLGSGGEHNLVLGLDGLLRVVGQEYLTLDWAQSWDHGNGLAAADVAGVMNRSLVRVFWERRGDQGFTYALDLSRVGRAFEPRLGFLQRRDYAKDSLFLSYGWRPGPESSLMDYSVQLSSTTFRRNADGTIETVSVEPGLLVDTKSGRTITLTVPLRYESLGQSFSLPQGVEVPAGLYRFAGGKLDYKAPQGDQFKPNVTVEGGQFYDGWDVSASIKPHWSLSKHLGLDVTYLIDHVGFPDRGVGFTSHVGQIKALVMLNTAASFNALVQYNSSLNAVTANFRFRYNPREGNNLWVVWNEGFLTERYPLGSGWAYGTDRTIMVKYTHTLQLDF